MHVTGDSLGLLVGVALVFQQVRRSKVEAITDPTADTDEGTPS
jgi:hypothetical protein